MTKEEIIEKCKHRLFNPDWIETDEQFYFWQGQKAAIETILEYLKELE